MGFAIAGIGLGRALIEISEEEFNCVKLAKRRIVRSLVIEDKYDLVIANYADFEREILDLALDQMIYSGLSWSSMRLDRQSLNRRIANLLSSGRLYIDQVIHDAGAVAGEEQALVKRLRKKGSEQYDTRLGYRVMEALRNYTQHRALPVHQLRYSSAWLPSGEFKNLVYRAVPGIVLQELRGDSRVKPSLIAELEGIGPNVPLTPLIREYIEGISVIHDEFRKCTQDDIQISEASFNWAWDRYKSASGEGRKDVEIVARNDEGECTDSEEIFEDIVSHRNDLARKNQVLTNLARRFVSGACELREA